MAHSATEELATQIAAAAAVVLQKAQREDEGVELRANNVMVRKEGADTAQVLAIVGTKRHKHITHP